MEAGKLHDVLDELEDYANSTSGKDLCFPSDLCDLYNATSHTIPGGIY